MGTRKSDRLIAGVVSGRGRCLVNLSIGPAHAIRQHAAKHQHAIAPPQRVVGLLDTGCNGLEIDQSIIARLGLLQTNEVEVTTAAGRVLKRIYPIELSLVTATGDAVYVVPDIEAREMPVLTGDFQALVGWSVIRAAKLEVDGPLRTFSLRF